jgi:ubiquinone/menaquinone biosynthesis C-methylase UbiE
VGLGAVVAAAVWAQAPPTHQHSFAGAEHWARMFDDPERDRWQRPREVITALGLAPDAAVADIGAGTGYFTVRLARMTPRGRIYAVDIEPDMVKYVTERAQHENLPNVTAVLAKADDSMLPAPVDLVLVVDTYHHIGGREAYFRRLGRHLKPDGAVAIIDFKADSPIGPPTAERLAAGTVKKEMAHAGYELVSEQDLPNQYFLIFHRSRP